MGILLNNVGASYSFPKYFDELTDDEVSTVGTEARLPPSRAPVY